MTRWEIPAYRVSWREGERTIVVTVYAHCVDHDWKFWRPWRPWDVGSWVKP